MSDMPPILYALPAVDREYDLPPVWDGRHVEWGDWELYWTTQRFHAKPEPCSRCGSTEEQPINLGKVDPAPGDTFTTPVDRKLKSGRTYVAYREVAAWPVIMLAAFRCPQCGVDTVWDKEADVWWDLDDSDYGDSGSVEPEVGQ